MALHIQERACIETPFLRCLVVPEALTRTVRVASGFVDWLGSKGP